MPSRLMKGSVQTSASGAGRRNTDMPVEKKLKLVYFSVIDRFLCKLNKRFTKHSLMCLSAIDSVTSKSFSEDVLTNFVTQYGQGRLKTIGGPWAQS